MRRKHYSANQELFSRETGGQKKKWKGRLPVAIIFPNKYRVGMSNLGFQLVFDLVNSDPDIVCERFFLPSPSCRPLSIESDRPLRDFPVILCSVSFENDYLNLLKIFLMSGISPLAVDRAANNPVAAPGRPLVICGGVATFINPEPLAPFVDMFIIGEAEPALPPVMEYLKKRLKEKDRESLLREMAGRFDGCYVPHFYEVIYHEDGTLASVSGPPDLPAVVKRVILPETDTAGYSRILTPDAEFADLFLVELGRGCSRGCRFCAAGFVYRPPRLWDMDAIINGLSKKPREINRVGLLGMEMARPDDLAQLAGHMLKESYSLSFSSLRADAVSPPLLELLEKSNVKSAAIAPDGSSERLRRVINKGITEDDLLQTAESLVRAGVMNLKLYYMIGLPSETMEDLDELAELTLKIKKRLLDVGRPRGRLANMLLSINCFVPKAWTPFQFHGFERVSELKKRLRYIRKKLTGRANITIKAEPPGNAFFQAVLARGDRRVGIALLEMIGNGKNWRRVLKSQGLDPEFFAMRERGKYEMFPWEIIDNGIDRNYLFHEYEKALKGKLTKACDTTKCRRCGVCDGGS